MFSNQINMIGPFRPDLMPCLAFVSGLNRYWRNLMFKKPGDKSSLDELKGSGCLLPSFHPDYRHPTPEQVDLLIAGLGCSQNQVAKLVDVVYTAKGSPTVRRWKMHMGSNEHRKIPYAAWRILVEFAGLASTEETIESASEYL